MPVSAFIKLILFSRKYNVNKNQLHIIHVNSTIFREPRAAAKPSSRFNTTAVNFEGISHIW